MRPLGPVESFQPALARTRAVLFQPFRLGRSWKKAFFAYLALCGSVFYPIPLVFLFVPWPGASPAARLALDLFLLVSTALMLAVFYLGSRMQFVLFDLVVSLQDFAAPLWRLRPASLILRWIALKLLFLLPLCLLLSLPLIPAAHHLGPQLHHLLPPVPTPGVPPPPPDPALVLFVFTLEGVLALLIGTLFLASSLLSDLVLPFLALEPLTLTAAVRRGLALVRQEPAGIAGFVAFQVLLTVAGLVAHYTVSTVASLIFLIPLALLAGVGYLALHAVVPFAALVVAGVCLYGLFLAGVLYIQLATFGILEVFLRAYSLIFLGSRYPLLGAYLFPPPPPPLPGVPLALAPVNWNQTS